MTRFDGEEYGDPYGEHRRRSLGDKIKGYFKNQWDKLVSHFKPKHQQPPDYNYGDYYGQDYYSPDVRPKKEALSPKKILNRIVVAGTIMAAMGAAFFNRDQISHALVDLSQATQAATATTEPPEQTPLPPTPTYNTLPTQEPTSTPDSSLAITHTDNYWGIDVNYNSDDVPLSYRVGDTTIPIDQTLLADLQQQAIAQQSPQLLFSVSVPSIISVGATTPYEPSVDRPLTQELPPDTLTETELRERGVTIIQGADVQLHLRDDAFAPGALLDTFQPDSNNHITIVLVDGPSVSTFYMQDPKYDSVRHLIGSTDANLEAYRQEQIDFWQRVENASFQNLQTAIQNDDQDHLQYSQADIILAQLRQEEYRNLPPEQLAIEAGMSEYAGLYNPASRTVFIAVGTATQPPPETEVIAYIDINGHFQLSNNTLLTPGHISSAPELGQSYPRPDDFHYNNSAEPPMGYPYGGQTAAQVARHEFMHDFMMSAHPTLDYMSNRGEYYTDTNTMQTIADAYETWTGSDYTDNSGYYLVFQLSDGTFVLGKSPASEKPTNLH